MTADRLEEIRRERRAGYREEREIRQAMLSGRIPLVGENYVAEISPRLTVRRIQESDEKGYPFFRELSRHNGHGKDKSEDKDI